MIIAVCVLIYLLVGLWSYFDAVQDIGWPPREVFWVCTVLAILIWPVPLVLNLVRVVSEFLKR